MSEATAIKLTERLAEAYEKYDALKAELRAGSRDRSECTQAWRRTVGQEAYKVQRRIRNLEQVLAQR